MRAIAAMLLAAIAFPVLAFPALAQPSPAAKTAAAPPRTTLKPEGDGTQPRQRYVTVFGTDECPKPSSIDEVVVCARLPNEEPYRIPKALRNAQGLQISPYEQNRSLLLGDATGGAGGGIGSCSVIGPGGGIGCNRKQAEQWAADRATRMGKTDEVAPPE